MLARKHHTKVASEKELPCHADGKEVVVKVLGIVGSPRIGGNTEQLTQEALRVVGDNGIDTELVRLAEKSILPCTGCGVCESEEICPLDDDLLPLYHRLKEAHGIILASPVYFGSASPQLKAFMDRAGYISYNNGYTLARKVGGPLVVAGRNGGNFTNSQLILWFMILGMIVPGSNDWNTAFGSSAGEIWDDSSGIDTARVFAENLAWLVKKLG
jgi:multimeric flavodoxin WrbA